MKGHLCYCNNCDVILIDKNPCDRQPLLEIPECAVEMSLEKDEDERFFACPICHEDNCLIDITSDEQLNHIINIINHGNN